MQLLITNPDMLHQSILPVHPTFASLLSNLAYVVVDEGHAYRCMLTHCTWLHLHSFACHYRLWHWCPGAACATSGASWEASSSR